MPDLTTPAPRTSRCAPGDDPARGRDRRLDHQRGAAVDRPGLHISEDDLSWVVNAYTLTFGGFLLLGGRLADFLGRRRMFIVGHLVFSVASLLGGLSGRAPTWLNSARALQGFGAALVSPAALSMITTIFAEGAERNRALGVWGAVAGVGGAAGVLLGGVLTQTRLAAGAVRERARSRRSSCWQAPFRERVEGRKTRTSATLDIPGAVTVTAGLALFVYALVEAANSGWGSAADRRSGS